MPQEASQRVLRHRGQSSGEMDRKMSVGNSLQTMLTRDTAQVRRKGAGALLKLEGKRKASLKR